MDRISVDREALGRVLDALNGPAHLIRELQATRRLPGTDENPVNILTKEYNDAATEYNTGVKMAEALSDDPGRPILPHRSGGGSR